MSQIQKIPIFKKCPKLKKYPKLKKCFNGAHQKLPKFKNDQNARNDGTAWAPKARRPTFGPLCIRLTILPFLCFCPFLVSIFAVGPYVLWVLCGPSKATVRCYTSICDGIIFIQPRMLQQTLQHRWWNAATIIRWQTVPSSQRSFLQEALKLF